jgi:hypothetical protein
MGPEELCSSVPKPNEFNGFNGFNEYNTHNAEKGNTQPSVGYGIPVRQ